jgi:hypothetical protein
MRILAILALLVMFSSYAYASEDSKQGASTSEKPCVTNFTVEGSFYTAPL